MNILKQWIKAQRGRSTALAKHLGVPQPFVDKMGNGERPVPLAHAAAIEQFTRGEVSRRDMFPDTWHRIWPELSDAPSNADADPFKP